MSNIEKLENILKNDVLIELSDNIFDLEEFIEKNSKDEDAIEELKYMQEVKAYFDEALLNIENKSMTEEIALDLLKGLEEMKNNNEEG